MTIISVPIRLRLATLSLFFSIFFIAFEVVLVSQSPWWRLPYRNIAYWSLAFLLTCIPLSVWITAAKRWAFFFSLFLTCGWILISISMSLRMKYPPLLFFSLFLGAFFFIVFLWLDFELKRTFFNPQLSWYQGMPKPIPGLKCQLGSGEKSLELSVSRIDKDGAFIFSPVFNSDLNTSLLLLLEKQKLQTSFNFRDLQISCYGNPTLVISRGLGVGLQFQGVSPDLRKEIGDFVEVLRAEGYV